MYLVGRIRTNGGIWGLYNWKGLGEVTNPPAGSGTNDGIFGEYKYFASGDYNYIWLPATSSSGTTLTWNIGYSFSIVNFVYCSRSTDLLHFFWKPFVYHVEHVFNGFFHSEAKPL